MSFKTFVLPNAVRLRPSLDGQWVKELTCRGSALHCKRDTRENVLVDRSSAEAIGGDSVQLLSYGFVIGHR